MVFIRGHPTEQFLIAPPEHSARGNRALATNGKGLSFMKITSIEAIPCNLLTIRPHKLAMAKITVPIMADEPLETVEDAFAFARLGAVDAFSLKVTKHGGFTNTRKVAAVAESAGISLFRRRYDGKRRRDRRFGAAILHTPDLALGLPIARSTAVIGHHRGDSDGLSRFPAHSPTGPGFGVTVDENKRAFHRRDVRHREPAA
jgi:L-alanine-DL-glutamate epimerase-like enolase superfamily enzyme